MESYEFDYGKYLWAKDNFHLIAWDDFANARKILTAWPCISNPYMIYGSEDYVEWQKRFNTYFKKRCTFPFMLRLINSFLITGNNPTESR